MSDTTHQTLDILPDGETLAVTTSIPRWQSLRLPQPFAPDLEAAFSRDHNTRMVPIRRTATLIAALLWAAFMFIDFIFGTFSADYRAVAPWLLAIRVLTFFVIGASAIHFFSDARVLQVGGYADRFLLGVTSFIYAAICLVTVLVPVPFDQLYFFNGLLVVIVGSFVLYGLRGQEARILAVVHLVLSLATVLWCQYGKADNVMAEARLVPVTTLGLLGATILICYASSLLLEAYARRNFLGRHALTIQSEKMFRHGQEMEKLNRELERSSQEAQTRMQAVIELKEKLRQEAGFHFIVDSPMTISWTSDHRISAILHCFRARLVRNLLNSTRSLKLRSTLPAVVVRCRDTAFQTPL